MAKQILIVDDSAVLRAAVRFALTSAGYEVIEAANGRRALSVLASMVKAGTRPDMIITDVNMPEMDGITFLRHLKKTPLRFVPTLVLTTESQNAKKMEGKLAGASGWLVKPFQPPQLVGVVRKFVR